MNHAPILRSALAVAFVVALGTRPTTAAAQVDVSGTWTMTVQTDNGTTNPTMTLNQQGSGLTGSYSSEALGENDVQGAVDGQSVTIRFTANLQGQGVPVVYRATIQDDGSMSGDLDIADGMLTGTFTAKRN